MEWFWFAVGSMLVAVFWAVLASLRKRKIRRLEIDLDGERSARQWSYTAVELALTPLGWAYQQNEAAPDAPLESWRRMKLYLGQTYIQLQDALGASDVEMAELRDQAALRDPPRRIPRYPQVPPYLATVEDVAHVPGVLQTPVALEDAETFARQWRNEQETAIQREMMGETFEPTVEGFRNGETFSIPMTPIELDDPVTQAELHVETGERLRAALGEPMEGGLVCERGHRFVFGDTRFSEPMALGGVTLPEPCPFCGGTVRIDQ